jgi:molecular chaperone DnaK (HSP70)
VNIGIDLGTTNSALAYIDSKEAAEADFPAIRVLEVPQYVAQGRIESRPTLPSFIYLRDRVCRRVRPSRAWCRRNQCIQPRAGFQIRKWIARENSAVGCAGAGRVLSPVEVSTRILKHLTDMDETARFARWRAQRRAHSAGRLR